ncbi:MAG: twin-arginine translocase subunit TatC [Planctomycetota bacterium]|jgi:sec-independent protein translocase protein TatC
MKIRRFSRGEYPNPDEVRMTLGEHLDELRSRMIRAIVGLLLGAVICFFFIEHVFAFLCYSLFVVLERNGYDPKLISLNPAEIFITYLKVSIIVGFIISAPYSLVQLWGFIAAGLYPRERKWVRRFVPVSITLFFTGAGFLLLIVIPLLLNFLLFYSTELPDISKFMPSWTLPISSVEPIDVPDSNIYWPTTQTTDVFKSDLPTTQPIPVFESDPEDIPDGIAWLNRSKWEIRYRFNDQTYIATRLKNADERNQLEPNMRISEYVMFVLHLAAAFGIGFQVPVIVAFLASVGIASSSEMARLRRYVWFGMAIAAAIFTPPDIASMLFLLLPMAFLFEVGLLAARYIERERS